MIDSDCREVVSSLWQTFRGVGGLCAGLIGERPNDGICLSQVIGTRFSTESDSKVKPAGREQLVQVA